MLLGKEINRLEEIAESGLEREISHPARLASLALLYFFRARREPAHRRRKPSQIMQEPPGYKSPTRTYESALLFWPITVIFEEKCLKHLPMHFFG